MSAQMPSGRGRFIELSTDECWELLEAKTVGRVALCTADGPRVFPVNYVVHDGRIYFRTSSYTQLATHLRHGRAAFQIDEADDFLQAGWSVLIVGAASWLEDPDDVPGTWVQRPEPWAEGQRTLHIVIIPTEVTGRRVLAT